MGDEVAKNNTNLGRELRNKINEISYFQCQLDLLKSQEKALKEEDTTQNVNLEEKCKLEKEEKPADDYEYEEGSGDEYYDEDEEDSEEYCDDDYKSKSR